MKYRDNMTAEEQSMMQARIDALDEAYATADLGNLKGLMGTPWDLSDEDLDPWIDLVRDAERP